MMRRWPLLLGLAVGYTAMELGLNFGEGAVQQWQLATRFTARAGFFLFIITFCASALVRLWPSELTKALLRDRRWWGLGFAASHTIHLVCFLRYFDVTGEPIPTVTLVGGGLAYLFLYAMALTSTRAAMKALGKNWKRLHKAGIYYLWIIFAQAYVGRIFDPDTRTNGILFTGIALAAMALRFAAWRKGRSG